MMKRKKNPRGRKPADEPAPSGPLRLAFDQELVELPLDALLPTKVISAEQKKGARYDDIRSSIKEVGLVEPLAVHPKRGGKYLLLDGHARLEVMRDLGMTSALCLLATDDEAYTYNRQVSRIPPVQAYRMLRRAREAGVDDARLARALNLNPQTLRSRRQSLDGLCSEALELLKDRPVAWNAFTRISKVLPVRQMEMAELMIAANTYSAAYAEALLVATPAEQRVDGGKKPARLSPQELTRLETEMKSVEREMLTLDDSYGRDVVHLAVARTYLRKLLDNGRVVRHLASKHPEILTEFQRIIDAESLEG